MALSLRTVLGLTIAAADLLLLDSVHFESWRSSSFADDQILGERVFFDLLTLQHTFLNHLHFHDLPFGLFLLNLVHLSCKLFNLWFFLLVFVRVRRV